MATAALRFFEAGYRLGRRRDAAITVTEEEIVRVFRYAKLPRNQGWDQESQEIGQHGDGRQFQGLLQQILFEQTGGQGI